MIVRVCLVAVVALSLVACGPPPDVELAAQSLSIDRAASNPMPGSDPRVPLLRKVAHTASPPLGGDNTDPAASNPMPGDDKGDPAASNPMPGVDPLASPVANKTN